MLFLLKLICCISGTIILAKAMNEFMRWWTSRPITEEKEHPFYITRTYEDIKNGYED